MKPIRRITLYENWIGKTRKNGFANFIVHSEKLKGKLFLCVITQSGKGIDRFDTMNFVSLNELLKTKNKIK